MKCVYNVRHPSFCAYSDCVSAGVCQLPSSEAPPKDEAPAPEAPADLVAKVEALNNNLTSTNCFLLPYLQYCSEGPDEWHLQLMHHSQGEVCRHLRIDNLNWHTLVVLLAAREEYGKQSFKAGGEHAVNKLAKHFKSIISD